jgi:hypothetical protein
VGVITSIVVFAVGAILDFAVTVSSPNFNINTVGVILMAAGAVGFVLSLFFWASWGGFGGGSVGVHRRIYRQEVSPGYGSTVVRHRDVMVPENTVIEEEQYQ